MKNFGDYVYFIYIGNNKNYSFRSYRDQKTGRVVGYVDGFNDKQQPVYREWRFNNDSYRNIRVHKDEIDVNGLSAVDFLRNSPECIGSPNGSYFEDNDQTGKPIKKQALAYFKEVNEDKDAQTIIDTRSLVIKAQSIALDMKGEELIDLCSLIGVFSDKDAIMTHRLLDYASNRPTDFLGFVEDPARKVKALIKKCLNSGILAKDGRAIKWEGKLLGGDEDEAVASLLKDKALKDSIELNYKKFGK